MKVAVFLTTEREPAAALLGALLTRWPGATFVAFANDEDRAPLQAQQPAVGFRRDKPPGGRWHFVRALRGERFDLAVVAWHGGERFLPLRVAALGLGCRVLAVDERGRESAVVWWQVWTWLPHLLRRGVRMDALQLARLAAGAYRWTVGLVLGAACLPARLLLVRLCRR